MCWWKCFWKLLWYLPGYRQGGDIPLHWRHNDHDGVSNHQPHGCLLNRLFRCRSMFLFDDVIMRKLYANYTGNFPLHCNKLRIKLCSGNTCIEVYHTLRTKTVWSTSCNRGIHCRVSQFTEAQSKVWLTFPNRLILFLIAVDKWAALAIGNL